MLKNKQKRLINVGRFQKFTLKLGALDLKLSLLVILMGIFLLPNPAYLAGITPENLIDLTNQERLKEGLKPLSANQLLTKAAILKGQVILETGSFKHTIEGRKFSAWIQEAGYNYSYVGENLAIDFETGQGVIEAWKESPSHKKNLLNPYYREIGVAAIDGRFSGEDTTVVVEIFGAPAGAGISAWPLSSDLNFLKAEAELAGYDTAFIKEENLLSHSLANRSLLPLNEEKIYLSRSEDSPVKLTTFFAQSFAPLAVKNFAALFVSFIFIYGLASLYAYYFSRLKKLLSA